MVSDPMAIIYSLSAGGMHYLDTPVTTKDFSVTRNVTEITRHEEMLSRATRKLAF